VAVLQHECNHHDPCAVLGNQSRQASAASARSEARIRQSKVITSVATIYLREHPELLEEAAETVRKDPQLRTLAGHEVRRHAGKHP
jgi:hypothetical protein